MKKLILAAAVASVASFHASAEVSIGGELEYRYNSNGDSASSESFADNLVSVAADYEVLDGVTASAGIDFDGGSQDGAIGLDFGTFAVSWGDLDSASDAFGVEGSIALGSDGAFTGESGKVMALTTNLGPAAVTLTSDDSGSGAAGTDLLITADLEAVAVKVGYQQAADDTFGAAVSFDAGVATLAADFSSNDTKDVTVFAVKAPLAETTTAAAGIINEDNSGTETTKWYAGVSYKFPMAKNVKVYGEVYDEDTAAGTGLVAGLEIVF